MHAPKQLPRVLKIFIFILLNSLFAIAQPYDDESEKSDVYGEGGKKVRFLAKTPNDGIREKIKWYDANGYVRETKITDEENDGKKIITHEFRDCKGRKTYYEHTITTKTGEELVHEEVRYEKEGRGIASGYKKTVNEKGEEIIFKYNRDKKDWERVQKDSSPEKISFEPDYETCSNSNHFLELFGGYSHFELDDDFGDDGLCGWELTGIYPLNNHWGVGLDLSGYYKSTDDHKFNLNFYQVLIMYYLINRRNPNRKLQFQPYLHAGAGVASYKSEFNYPGIPKFESKETSFAGVIGGGVDLNWGRKLSARLLQADYVLSKFSDQTQSNYRLSTGLVLRIGQH